MNKVYGSSRYVRILSLELMCEFRCLVMQYVREACKCGISFCTQQQICEISLKIKSILDGCIIAHYGASET